MMANFVRQDRKRVSGLWKICSELSFMYVPYFQPVITVILTKKNWTRTWTRTLHDPPWGPGQQPCVRRSSRHCWPGSAGLQAEPGRRAGQGSQWGHPEVGGTGGDAACPPDLNAPPHGEPYSRPADERGGVYEHMPAVLLLKSMIILKQSSEQSFTL